ncbi:heterokaryon incompatibility protein-domain-containing protein [Paraphoma chrysanthemicola]|nr:heterokaryon incompatibility protein-domain-containing protein [Paraphoma chrysanthemicola]
MDGIRNQVQSWLNKCSSDHPHCSIDREAKLPTRVLSLSEDLQGLKIRLIKSKASRGEYCALSHCWGPADKIPLRTTSNNLQQHLFDIPYKELPQTFQESVTLIHSLGFKYLWIDSLCILQDDQSDWQSEAKEMRNVYRNASLVIAASGAADSSQGLFIQSRPHALVTKLPFDIHDETKGYFNAALIPWSGEDMPYRGVLNTRAWALQERYLARRFLAFMPGGVSWMCDSIKLNERDETTDHGFLETYSWNLLLESYTRQKLTYPADRLEALRGIVTEIQETRMEQFDFRYGVWKDTFHEDLLWVPAKRDLSSDVFNLPTWSWAATGGAKHWCRSFVPREILRLPELLEANDSGSMHTSGHMTKALPVLQTVPKQLFERFSGWPDGPAPYVLEYRFTYYESLASTCKACSIVGGPNSSILMGIAIFDRIDPTPHAQYFFIASTFRKKSTKRVEKQDSDSNKPQVNDKDTAAYDIEQYEGEILAWDQESANASDWAKVSEGMSAEDMQTVSVAIRSLC